MPRIRCIRQLERRQPGDHRRAGACAKFLTHGLSEEALAAYDAELCKPVSEVVLRNRGAGPFGLLNLVNERCGGEFDDIDDVVSPKEREDFMAQYKTAAGFARDALNAAAPMIGARIRNDSG